MWGLCMKNMDLLGAYKNIDKSADADTTVHWVLPIGTIEPIYTKMFQK